MGCCCCLEGAIARWILFAFNVVLFLCGAAVIGIGSYVQAVGYTSIIGNDEQVASILLIVVGCIAFILGFLGCCGALKKSKCMLYTYAVILLLVVIVEIVAGILAFVSRDDLRSDVTTGLAGTIPEYCTDSSIKDQWDAIQSNLYCCGVNGPGDWNQYTCPDIWTPPYPASCCADGTCEDLTTVYTQDCITAMTQELKDESLYIGIVAIILGIVELLGIAFACCVAN